ncbi:hypothetical protein, partial [Polyangium spumosum]|uniref:hypothetical protein n=1 Tax=Polyangium spumosum TaxID=889282 RepID=UPI00147835F4
VDEVFVEPGNHAIKAMKGGYWLNQTFVKIGPGERQPLSIAMQLRYESHHVAFGRPVSLNINANLGERSEPTWPRNLMIASGVGIGLGLGGLITGLIMNVNAPDDGTVTTGKGLAYAGGIVGALSVTGLIIGIASRPTPPNVIIQPQVSNDGGGIGVSGVIP